MIEKKKFLGAEPHMGQYRFIYMASLNPAIATEEFMSTLNVGKLQGEDE